MSVEAPPKQTDPVAREPELVDALPTNALEALVRGEVDVQIQTAKRYPRSLELFTRRAIAMATMDEETAESCIYRRPVGKKRGANGRMEEEFAEGMSIRMAEIVGASYGNLRVAAQLVEQTPQFVRARGMAIDLETNFASSSEVIESTLKADGTPFSARMRVVVAKACLSKARRDATFQVVPKALAKPVETEVRQVLMGNSQTLEKRRARLMSWIQKLGIEPARVWAAIGVAGQADLGPDHLIALTGIRTAITDNETTIDEAFPPRTDDQRDHLEEELADVGEELATKLRGLFAAKKQSKGQAIAFVRQYKNKLQDLVAVLEAIPTTATGSEKATTTNGAAGSQQHEARSREMPSAGTGPVGGSTPLHQMPPVGGSSASAGSLSGQEPASGETRPASTPPSPLGPRPVPPPAGKRGKFSI